jgi:hypothetical protein
LPYRETAALVPSAIPKAFGPVLEQELLQSG